MYLLGVEQPCYTEATMTENRTESKNKISCIYTNQSFGMVRLVNTYLQTAGLV